MAASRPPETAAVLVLMLVLAAGLLTLLGMGPSSIVSSAAGTRAGGFHQEGSQPHWERAPATLPGEARWARQPPHHSKEGRKKEIFPQFLLS